MIRLAVVAVVAGCQVPLGLSSPRGLPLGPGRSGAHAIVEFPSADVLATAAAEPDPASPETVPRSDMPRLSLALSHGMTERLDLELDVEAEIATVVPVPHAMTAGVRVLVLRQRRVALAAAAAAGYGGFWAEYDEYPNAGSTVRAIYGRASVALELWPDSWAHPVAAGTFAPLFLIPNIDGGGERDPFMLWTGSFTAGVKLGPVTPFVAAGLIAAPDPRGTSPMFSAGIAGSVWR